MLDAIGVDHAKARRHARESGQHDVDGERIERHDGGHHHDQFAIAEQFLLFGRGHALLMRKPARENQPVFGSR